MPDDTLPAIWQDLFGIRRAPSRAISVSGSSTDSG
jgi:hypothetical protein